MSDREVSNLIAKPTIHIKIGLIGLPNTGKSTLFNVISGKSVPCEDFPFCTIDPNIAVCPIKDEKFQWLCDMYKPLSSIQQYFTIIDTFGLVKRSYEGAGMGNGCLNHLRNVDILCQVVRAFESEDLTHAEGSVDPIRDIEIIQQELFEKDKEIVRGLIVSMERNILQEKEGNEFRFEFNTLVKINFKKAEARKARGLERMLLQAQQSDALTATHGNHCFFTAKEMVIVINLSKRDFLRISNTNNNNNTNTSTAGSVTVSDHHRHQYQDPSRSHPVLSPILSFINEHKYGIPMPISIIFEKEVAYLRSISTSSSTPPPAPPPPPITTVTTQPPRLCGWEEYVAANPTQRPVTDSLIETFYSTLKMIHFYIASAAEVRSIGVREETFVTQAAALLHTDFERGFICAEVMTVDDIHDLGDEYSVRREGKMRQEGRKYFVNDGDVISFKYHPPK
eukprot:gene7642-15645_t